MKIRIHRGTNQIGGCITEIQSASGTRILIDLGHNLPGESEQEDKFEDPTNLSALLDGISGIIYTHNHGDHLGFFHQVPEAIPQYIGQMSKEVVLNILEESLNKAMRGKHQQLIEEIEHRVMSLRSFRTYTSQQTIKVGDVTVTPYFVSHSAADSHMLLIECDGKRVLHTGDVREHGFLGKGLQPTLLKWMTGVDVLITEGTMLSRDDDQTKTEHEIQAMMHEYMQRYKNVFVLCSSTNFDRLAGLHKANMAFSGRPFVCDVYQHRQFMTLSQYCGRHSSLYRIYGVEEMSLGNEALHQRMVDNGFTMLVRDNGKFRTWLDLLLPKLDPEQTVLIYSQYKGYLDEQPKLQEFVSLFGNNMAYVHTSGHATRQTLAKVCRIVNPSTAIIPIHRDPMSDFRSLDIPQELKDKVVESSVCKNGIEIQID